MEDSYERSMVIEMIFFLMHENDKLAVFDYSNASISGIVLNEQYQYKLPFMEISSKTLEDRVAEWILNRGIPVTRQRIETDLAVLNTKNVIDYMVNNLGLSLTDHYWLCPKDSSYTWENINLYTNDFKSVYSLDLRDDKKTIAGKTDFVPSASLKGDLKKKWIIDEQGTRRLVKGNYNHSCRQSLCEVLASEIHKRQGRFEYTPYSLIEISSDNQMIIGCECPDFTTVHTEFIAAIEIVNSIKKSNSESVYESYIQYCGKHGIDVDYMRAFMEYQILTDFIITNTDRHLNNFGVIRDSKTFQFIKPAPIFDSGNSMFYNTSHIKADYGLLNVAVTSFRDYEIQLLEYVQNPLLVDINLLPSPSEVKSLLMKDESCLEETVDKLVNAYGRKVDFLSELQSGQKIYSYHYLKQHGVKLDNK